MAINIGNEHTAITMAVQIVTAALQSNSIKLLGPVNSDLAKANLAVDSAYINDLINAIAKNIYVGE